MLKGGPDAEDTSKEDYLRAYEAVLEPHHPWIVRKAVHVRGWRKETYILYSLPRRTEIICCLLVLMGAEPPTLFPRGGKN